MYVRSNELFVVSFVRSELQCMYIQIHIHNLTYWSKELDLPAIALAGRPFFYAFNKVFFVLGYIGAEDVGGSMTIVSVVV